MAANATRYPATPSLAPIMMPINHCTTMAPAIPKKLMPVIARPAAEWSRLLANNPFADAAASEPNLVMLALSKQPPRAHTVDALLERATNGERVERVGDALWIHFAGGVGRSRISPGVLDRRTGSAVTTRNWRTALKLAEMAEASVPSGPAEPPEPSQ